MILAWALVLSVVGGLGWGEGQLPVIFAAHMCDHDTHALKALIGQIQEPKSTLVSCFE